MNLDHQLTVHRSATRLLESGEEASRKNPAAALPYIPTAKTEGSLKPASIDILQYGEIPVGTETEGYIHTSQVISPTTHGGLVRRPYFAAFFSWHMVRGWQKGLLAVSY